MIFREKEVTIQSGVELRGTLSFPENSVEKLPAVLIIPGTGNLDRDGKVNKKLDVKLYRQLAEFLTNMGIINLRYDKRGVGASGGDYYAAGMWDLVEDARACVQYLKGLPEVDPEKIILLGHSEGSMLSTAVAAREELGGAILLAGAAENLSEALIRQREIAIQDVLNMKGFKGTLLRLLGTHKKIEPAAQKLINKVLSSKEDVVRFNGVRTNARWMREHFAYNIREDLSKITCPVLAITGARDIQATPGAVETVPQYVKGDSEYYIIENMGHSCKYITKTSTILTARKDIVAESVLPIHPELLTRLEGWLKKIVIQPEEKVIV
jgi:alpha-beta hydrolase superfamily lysophospholipase